MFLLCDDSTGLREMISICLINVRETEGTGNKEQTIQKKLATLGTQDEDKKKTQDNMCWTTPYTRRRQTKQKTQQNMCWTPLTANKYR